MYNDEEIRQNFHETYRYAADYWSPFLTAARTYTLAGAGSTWSFEEQAALIKEGREPIELNIMRRPQQFYSGYLRDNINEVIYSPVEGSDQKTADQFSKLSYYIWDKGLGFPTFLDAADEAMKSGISLCGIYMDYSKDFINGDIGFYKRCYDSFLLDPTFSDISLRDCSFGIMRDLIDKQYAKSLLPFIDAKEIDSLSISYRDDKFLQYHPQFQSFSRNRNLIAYDQYYTKITKKRTFLVDTRGAFYKDITNLESDEKKKLKIGIRRFDELRSRSEELQIDENEIPQLEIHTVDRQFVELNILLNGHRVYCGPDKTGVEHTYPFAPSICYLEPSIWQPEFRVQGLSACNYSLQRQFVKRHMKIIDMMDSEISTGFKYLLGSVPNPQEMQQAGQSRLVGVDPSAPAGLDSVQQLHGGNANASIIEYQKVLDDLSLTLANVNESLLGVDQGGNTQISGRLAEVRIAQGLRGNRKLFDNIETAQLILGGLILTTIQTHYSAGKVERILGESPTEQFYNNDFEQYDAVIKQGIRSKSQKDAYYYELVNLKKEGVVNVPENAIVKALSMVGLSDLEEEIKQQDKMLSARQAQMDEKIDLEMRVLNAVEQEKLGLAKERESRTVSNLALKDERESEAQQNIAQAALDRAKAITEIASMHQDRIMKVLDFVNQLEMQEAEGRELQKAQVASQSDEINDAIDETSQKMNQNSENDQQQDQQAMMQSLMEDG